MTKAQEQMRLHRVDAAATKVIPESAYWHMQHRPYQNRGGDTDAQCKANQRKEISDQ